ncbi:Zn-dependent alcohol dehydrogenase [Aquamicrobium segne]|uniref:Zn-dependent alcohol dehydrogenase n=1 Tax=Aquamicrobium segne TaxID=469547 RepID=A0ABW0H3G7_9HYPH
MKMKAAVLREFGKPLSLETIDIDDPGPGEVRVKIKATSLCHTDLEVIHGQLNFPVPIVLGHEAAGTVERVGGGVTSVAVGDHVVLSWNPSCGRCFYCDQSQPILCEPFVENGPKGGQFDGTTRLRSGETPIHNLMYMGSFAEYCVVPAQSAVPIPKDMPFDRACLLGCGVMTGVGAATRVAKVTFSASVAVFGCGAVGLSAVQGARLCGAKTIVAVDLDDRKLEIARQLGATAVVNAATGDPVEFIRQATNGRGADYVFESAGSERAFRSTMEAVRPNGQVVWLGKVNVQQDVSFRWGSLMGEKRVVRSSYGGARPHQDFPALARSYLSGELKLDELVTRNIRLEEINEGFDALASGDVIRSVITF